MKPYCRLDTCVKCGETMQIRTSYRAGRRQGHLARACAWLLRGFNEILGPEASLSELLRPRDEEDEHLLRTCHTCGYGWAVSTADRPSPLHQLASQAE